MSDLPKLSLWLCLGLAVGCGQADRDAGEEIARNGTGQGVPACMDCHGAEGGGQTQPPFPRLAGLPEEYLTAQLNGYAEGTRDNATMAPIVNRLEQREREALAVYYSTLPPAGGPHSVPQELAERGSRIVREGLPDRSVEACHTCHGEAGREARDTLPPLAGQPPQYLLRQLEAFAAAERRTDVGSVMQDIASQLSREEMAAAAAYFASQPARPPE